MSVASAVNRVPFEEKRRLRPASPSSSRKQPFAVCVGCADMRHLGGTPMPRTPYPRLRACMRAFTRACACAFVYGEPETPCIFFSFFYFLGAIFPIIPIFVMSPITSAIVFTSRPISLHLRMIRLYVLSPSLSSLSSV